MMNEKSLISKIRELNRKRLNARRGKRAAAPFPIPVYRQWVDQYDTLDAGIKDSLKQRMNALRVTPLISVVMPVYNPDLAWLEQAILSVKQQIYPNWELCIADDCSRDDGVRTLLERFSAEDSRIKVHFREENGHISAASNSALSMVQSSYVGFLDHDDILREHALLLVAEALNEWPNAKLVYSDEDKIDPEGRRCEPHFKTDWNPELLIVQNYICHFTVLASQVIHEVGGFREGYEGAQDHDLLLRCSRVIDPQDVVHIPHILYHWRQHVGSTSLQASGSKTYADEARRLAISDHLNALNVPADVELGAHGWGRLRWRQNDERPLVSIIIPTRNGLEVLSQCLSSVFGKTLYAHYEILVIDNGSDDPEALNYLDKLAAEGRINLVRDDSPFNYSALNNKAAALAKGDYLVLLNNDVEVIGEEWLNELISVAALPGVGAVGARLYYSNGALQHAGVLLGIGGVAGHAHKHLGGVHPGYMGRAQLLQTMSAVTGACLAIKKSTYELVGGLDESTFAVAFNDVDFCLRLRARGFRNVWNPHAELFHHESISRGSDEAPEKRKRFALEVAAMQERWGDCLKWDPAYNPNLTLVHEDFSISFPPRVTLMKPWFREVRKVPAGEVMLQHYGTTIDLSQQNESHTLVFNHVTDSARAIRVLDIGCAAGDLGAALKSRGLHVTGVEPSAVAAASAYRKLDDLFLGTFDEYCRSFDGVNLFDSIILADVLEHTSHPELVLRRLREMVAPKGTVVISVPNVTHGSVCAMLLDGQWIYGDRGILDKTHLRFFSRRSLIELLTSCGMSILRLSATTADARSVGVQFGMNLSEKSIEWTETLAEDPESVIVQYIITASFESGEKSVKEINQRWYGDFQSLGLTYVVEAFAKQKERKIANLSEGRP